MREHAVKDDGDAVALGGLTERLEVLVGAEERVDLAVVGGVVAVVLVALEDGVEVEARHAEVGQIRQLLLDTGQVAAEIVVVPDMPVLVGTVPRRLPPLAHDAAGRDIVMHLAALGEAVREDLVHDAALEEVRRGELGIVDRGLEEVAVVDVADVAGGALDVVPLPADGIGEVVVVDADILRDIAASPDVAVLLLADDVQVDETLLEPGAEQHQHRAEIGL